MFFRILKKELKRKKTLNIILFLFIVMATMFLASSVSNLKSVTGAIDYFMEISKVPDNIVISVVEDETDVIAEFLKDCRDIKEYEVMDCFNIVNERIKIVKSQGEKEKYERTNTLIVQALSDNFMKVFDENGNPLKLAPGEIAVSKMEAEENQLAVGDKLRITVGEVEQEFTIVTLTKDVVFGSSMIGFKRHIICQEDFDKFAAQKDLLYAKIYCTNYKDKEAFQKHWQEQNFSVISTIEGKKTVPMVYVFDMLIAGILIIVSICLILIAFLVLRFTIHFTLQGDFREIGIMKAIGLKNKGIKGIYMIKYLMLAVAGAILGLVFSFPFANLLLKQVAVNMVVKEAGQNTIIHVLCAIAIVGIVLLFTNSCTGKLKKFSAIDAIRNGSNGERYHTKNPIKLWKRKQMKPGFYMACNDIFSNPRRFFVLGITFCIGTLLILLPLSAAHTLKGDRIMELFGMCPSDVYVDNGKGDDYVAQKNLDIVLDDMEEMKNTLKEHGITAEVGTDMGYMIPCYSNDEDKAYNYYILQEIGSWERSYARLEGREPEAEDELMITEKTAEEMGVFIGDTVTFQYPDREEEFIITGTYQSMMEMGQGFRVSPKAKLDANYMAGIIGIQIDVADMESEEAWEKIQEIFPDYKVMQKEEFLGNMIGSIVEQIDVMVIMITVLVLVINSMITVLTMKTMTAKERGDIAMLKSLGFTNATIRGWQVKRILLILISAILLGIVLAKLLAPITIAPIFAMMGASSIELTVKPLETYVIYPLVLLSVTGLSALFSTIEIGKVDAKEVNNME